MNDVFKACFAIFFASTALLLTAQFGGAADDKEKDVKDLQKADRCGEQALSAGCERVGVELALHPFCRKGASGLARVLGHKRCNAASPRYVSAAFPDRSNLQRREGRLYQALREVSAKIAVVGDRVAREEHEKFGDDVPERAQRPSHVVEPGTENLESIPIEFIHLRHAETQDALMIAFPAHGILITQDLVYNRVHAMVGESAFESWTETLEKTKNSSYDRVLPGHGVPGGKELYGWMQQYLATARHVYARATDGEVVKKKMIPAFPDYGGVGMLDQQKRFLFPGGKA
jgi:glyoxylase-like metal-dependent hydrolase (beta-lactamase superfamily II)